uniref:Uncharacterized protein n=1 Tax=Oryza barthii TaxID=65489 RepID=A0A0D3FEX6_9ORYZ
MGFSPWAVKRVSFVGEPTAVGAPRRDRWPPPPCAAFSPPPPPPSLPLLLPVAILVAVPVPVRERRRSVLPIQIAPPHSPACRTPPPAVGPPRLRLPVKIRHRAAVLRCLRLLSEIRSTAQPLLCTSASATKSES